MSAIPALIVLLTFTCTLVLFGKYLKGMGKNPLSNGYTLGVYRLKKHTHCFFDSFEDCKNFNNPAFLHKDSFVILTYVDPLSRAHFTWGSIPYYVNNIDEFIENTIFCPETIGE